MSHSILFFDDEKILKNLRPLTYTRKLSELHLGLNQIQDKWTNISTDLHLLGSLIPDPTILAILQDLAPETSLWDEDQLIAFKSTKSEWEGLQKLHLTFAPRYIRYPEDLLTYNAQLLHEEIKPNSFDLEALKKNGNTFLHPENCFIHPSANLYGCILDASQGPIYIGERVQLQIGTLIQGPAAMLADSSTNLGAKIRVNTTIGIGCKVGGEINASLFFPYTNKAHEGYVGSSIIGSFSNWGALSTCSNVRNDLAPISLYDYASGKSRKTNQTAFGVLMGDFVTTGIGTKFNTGTVIGNHCNISGISFLPKFIPSLTWGEFPNFSQYRQDKALQNAIAWAATKNQVLPKNMEAMIDQIWKEEASFRN
jgi:hypothetical protein